MTFFPVSYTVILIYTFFSVVSGSTSSDLSGLEGLVNAAAANAHDPNNYYAVHAHHHHQHHHGMHQVHHPHHGYSSANNVNFQLWSFFELFARKSICFHKKKQSRVPNFHFFYPVSLFGWKLYTNKKQAFFWKFRIWDWFLHAKHMVTIWSGFTFHKENWVDFII